jgi:hypothetical protein
MACAAPDDEAVQHEDQTDLLGLEEQAPAEVVFTKVTAQGTGCPAGSTETSIASDGQVFTTTFSAYEVEVGSLSRKSTKDCSLGITLRSAQPTSYAVTSIYYGGYAFLEEGVTARHTVRYGFRGTTSANAGRDKNELVGPYDSDFVLEDEIGATKRKWSPCATEHQLNASTELRLQSARPEAAGYANLSATDGSLKLVVKVASRRCETRKR